MAIRVETQGISPDFASVTGDYEPIDRGDVTAKDLKGMLERLSQMSPLRDGPGKDYCPPALFATGADAKWSFTHDGRGLFCEELDDYVEPVAAVKQVTGRATSASRGRRKFPAGRVPQRHPGLEPTNDVSLSREEVNQATPFLVMTARSESTTWKGLFYVGLVLSAIGTLLAAMGVVGGDMPTAALGTAAVCLLLGLGMVGWAVTHRKETLTAGVDWSTNSLWMWRGDRFSLVGNANCIVSIDVTLQVTTDGEHDTKSFEIHARYSGGKPSRVGQFDQRREAVDVANRLMAAVEQTPLPASVLPSAQPTSPVCPQCGLLPPVGARFCEGCGRSLA